MKVSKYILLFSLAFALNSCEDAFSTTLKIDPPAYEDLLVANLFMSNIDEFVGARVSHTVPVLEDLDFEDSLIDDATLEVYESGDLFMTLEQDDQNYPNTNYLGELKDSLVEGKTYELRIQHSKYGLLTARQTMPNSVPIENLEITRDAGKSIDGEDVSAIEFKFNDPAGIENFYAVSVAYVDTFTQSIFPVYLESEDPVVQYSFNADLLIPDQTFDGKRFTVRVLVPRYDIDNLIEDGYLIWKSLTKDYFEYSSSLYRYDEGFGGFAEPTIVTSNVEGGLGCFGLSQVTIHKLPR